MDVACSSFGDPRIYIVLNRLAPAFEDRADECSAEVTAVGAGVSGLCSGYELKNSGFEVTILEASFRVGGRVIMLGEPSCALAFIKREVR